MTLAMNGGVAGGPRFGSPRRRTMPAMAERDIGVLNSIEMACAIRE
jgi:hypothetical protein